jgi:phosphoesterase RecJ-like protein
LEDGLPPNYYFLPGAELITFARQGLDYSGYPHVIYSDCAEKSRIGDQVPSLLRHTVFSINIDHHVTNDRFGDMNLIAPKAANAENVFHLVKELGVAVTPDIALALYTAFVMDTGGFSYAEVTGDTLRDAAELIDCGADPVRVNTAMNESRDVRDLELLGLALSHLEYTDDRRLSWMSLSYDEAVSIRAADLHPEGVANFARKLKGVEVALFFRETEPGLVKISLRSKGRIDVARLAADLGGGGHTHASGMKRQGDLETVKRDVVRHFKEVLNAK